MAINFVHIFILLAVIAGVGAIIWQRKKDTKVAAGLNTNPPVPIAPVAVAPAGAFDLPLDPAAWNFLWGAHSPALTNGVSFSIPMDAAGDVHILNHVMNMDISAKKQITVNYTMSVSADAVFKASDPKDAPPCKVGIMLQRQGDDWSGQGPMVSYRWFAPVRNELKDGQGTLTIAIDPNLWTNVFGGKDATAFAGAMSHIANFAIVFGGASFDAHGVSLKAGSASFTLNKVTIE